MRFETVHGVNVMLSEKHPREAEIAKKVLEPYRHYPSTAISADDQWCGGIEISRERADDLEMKICEALVEASYSASRDAFGVATKGGEII